MGIVKNERGQVLIIHRVKEEEGTGSVKLSWAFPGGGKDFDGETKEQVAVRELIEETGYEVKPSKIISEREHPNFPVYVYYMACSLQGSEPVQKAVDPEVEGALWVYPYELANYFTSDFDQKVQEYLRK